MLHKKSYIFAHVGPTGTTWTKIIEIKQYYM